MIVHERIAHSALLLTLCALMACAPHRAQTPRTDDLGCGSLSAARGIANYARAFLFPQLPASEGHAAAAARLRGLFYPDLQADHPILPVTDPLECARVVAAFRSAVPDVAAELRGVRDTAHGGRSFAIVRIGHYYHFATMPLSPPGTIMLHGGASWMARRTTTLQFMHVVHQQF